MQTDKTIQTVLERKDFNATDRHLIERAFQVAEECHKDQKRQSGELYISHPIAVANMLSNMGLDAATISAGLLHDTLEDTEISAEKLIKEFGHDVAFLVQGVTKLKSIQYSRKHEIDQKSDPQVESLKKMFFAMAEDIRVILIKLADRYHNMKTLEYKEQESQIRKAIETMEIYAPIAGRLGMGHLKGELEDLAFPYIYPQEYKALLKMVKDEYTDRLKYIGRTKPLIERHLKDSHITVLDIHARAKHYWSLYQKLRGSDMNIEKIFDLVAIRIIVPDIKSCYEVLGIIHKFYKPLPGRIKDYIALPKPNGYRSLHTTVFCEKGKIAEIQIRTPEMHEFGEKGIAAHWAYSESGKNSARMKVDPKELSWINQLKESLHDIKTRESLKNLKVDFFKNRIFIFTPLGDVMDLPDGATPIDFAYAIHTNLGDAISGAKINNKLSTIDTVLHNGDVVEIVKSKTARPSLSWLNMTNTALAQKNIKSWLKRNDPTIAILNGKGVLNDALKKFNTNMDKLGRKATDMLLETFSGKTMDDLYTRLSVGDVDVQDVIRQLVRNEFLSLELPKKKERISQPKPAVDSSAISMDGHKDILYKLGRCCNPRPPIKIVGYITRSRGLTIHTQTCKNARNASTERIREVDWT